MSNQRLLLEDVEIFLLDVCSWTWAQASPSGPAPPARLGQQAAQVGEALYLFGGLVLRDGDAGVDKAVYMLSPEGELVEVQAPEESSAEKEELENEEEVEELSFEELLEQEKAFFKLQNKTSFPREVRKSKKTR